MGPQAKREYLEALRPRYRRAGRARKTNILNEVCETCGYERKYAIRLLCCRGRRKTRKRGPKPLYGAEVLDPIKTIWLAAEQPCSKRLKAAVTLWMPFYEQHHSPLPPQTRQKILDISPATIDRLMRPVRARHGRRGICATRSNLALRAQIPVRTNFWEVTTPGFFEADTVAHCGASLAGAFVWSLTFTDIYSGWTENRAVWNKSSRQIVERLEEIEQRLAFDVQGFDCDNGSEFLNHRMWRHFHDRHVPVLFTRSRPYRKNDNAHVEQKQWTHVRQLLGYERFEDRGLVKIINDLYSNEWWALQNFFCPNMKLLSKERVMSKIRRYHDKPRTPYQRLIDCPDLDEEAKDQLRNTFARLDPFDLKKELEQKLRRLFNRLRRKRK